MDETLGSSREGGSPELRFEDIWRRLLGGALSALFAEFIWPMDHAYFARLYILLRIRRLKKVIVLLCVLLFGDRLLDPAERETFIAPSASVAGYVFVLTSLRFLAVACSVLLEWRFLHVAITVIAGSNFIATQMLPSSVSLRLQDMQGRGLIWCLNVPFRIWLRSSKISFPPWLSRPFAAFNQWTLWLSGLPPMDQLPDFDYADVSPANPRQIRLLRLQRRFPFREIEAQLMVVDVDHLGIYDCISYVWGSDTELTHAIRLNSKRFRVRRNVHQILSQQALYWGSKVIWIDGICINQGDMADKTNQVRMMTEIYTRAARVFICLGDPPKASLAVLVLYWMRLMRRYAQPDTKHRYRRRFRALKSEIRILSAAWQEFIRLLRHTWFQRVWIVQEIALAQSPIVSYGRYWFSWDLFVDDIRAAAFGKYSMVGQKDFASYKYPFAAENATQLRALRKRLRLGQRPSLSEALGALCNWRATMPRDKLFALFGLTDDAEFLNSFIDYEKKEDEEILCDVARYFAKRHYLLDALYFGGIGWGKSARNPNFSGLPSWAPDWTMPRTPTSLAIRHPPKDSTHYSAATQQPPQLARFRKSLVLKAQGVFLGTLNHAGPVTDFEFSDDQEAEKVPNAAASWLEKYESFCCDWAPDPYHNGDSRRNVISKMLVGHRTNTSRPAPPGYNNIIDRLRASLRLSGAAVRTYPGEGVSKSYTARQKEHEQLKRDHPVIKSWEEEMEAGDITDTPWIFGNPSFPRRVFATAKGYLVAAPSDSMPGDIVVAIFGARVPFVLRPVRLEETRGQTPFPPLISDKVYNQIKSEGYDFVHRLVGECYVHGMMDGERLKPGDDGQSFLIV